MSSATLNNLCMIRVVVDAAANATPVNVTVPRAGIVTGGTVIATATSGGGTMTISKAGSAINTGATACAAADAATLIAVVTQANASFVAGDILRVVCGQAADRGIACVHFLPTGYALTVA